MSGICGKGIFWIEVIWELEQLSTHPPTRIRFPSAVGVLFEDEPHRYSVGQFVGRSLCDGQHGSGLILRF